MYNLTIARYQHRMAPTAKWKKWERFHSPPSHDQEFEERKAEEERTTERWSGQWSQLWRGPSCDNWKGKLRNWISEFRRTHRKLNFFICVQVCKHQTINHCVVLLCDANRFWTEGGICVSSVRTLSFSTWFAQFETQFGPEYATQISGNVICVFNFRFSTIKWWCSFISFNSIIDSA